MSEAKSAAAKYQPVTLDAHKSEAPRSEAYKPEGFKPDAHKPEAPKPETAKPRRLKRSLIRFLLLIIVPLGAIAGGAWFYLHGGRYAGTDDAYTKADMVQISADVSARVVAIEVKDNQPVKAGQVLFRLDDETFRIALEKAEAKLVHTRNDLQALQASYHQKETDLKSAQADLTYWSTELGRQQKLAGEGFATKSTADQTRRSADMARAQVAGDQRALDALAAQLDGDPDLAIDEHAAYKEAVAERDQAALDMRHTVVTAPADGIVGQVPNLQVGNYLTAGTAAFNLVRSDQIWVEANMKETDLTYVRPGQNVIVTIDTYPDRQWEGKVASLSATSGSEMSVLPPQNASGNWVKIVQRIPVRIELNLGKKHPPISAGMSAVVEIDTGHRRSLPLIGPAVAESGSEDE
ncbi:MAG TPA: HlyD family secretion protein [Dongiaceae bacterium]|jgi:membrane fusion protein (multidrug efflux system)|nr:HlyD family secretion protein [Dongiaceae bacterium]